MYGAECKTFFPQGSRKNCKNYYDSMYTKLRTRREHPHYLWKRQSPRKNILGSFMWPKMVEPNTKCIPLQQLFFLIKLTVTSCFSWLINKNETFFFSSLLSSNAWGPPGYPHRFLEYSLICRDLASWATRWVNNFPLYYESRYLQHAKICAIEEKG